MRTPRDTAFLVLCAAAAFGQPPDPLAFEVASVKPAPATASTLDFRTYPGGRLEVTNLTLKVILREAYGIKAYQLSGGPGWLDSDRFDIAAKAAGDASREEMMLMLQSLLAERFQLKVHRESKEGNVYALVVGKGGPKLTPSKADRSFVSLQRNDPPTQPGVHYTIVGQKASLGLLAERLGEMQLSRPVIDRTGIQGEFDFQLSYAIDDNPESGVSIFSAIQEQLGLRLEATKGPVETLVIDHAERPSGN